MEVSHNQEKKIEVKMKTKQKLELSINRKVYLRKPLCLKCPKCNSQEVEATQMCVDG